MCVLWVIMWFAKVLLTSFILEIAGIYTVKTPRDYLKNITPMISFMRLICCYHIKTIIFSQAEP